MVETAEQPEAALAAERSPGGSSRDATATDAFLANLSRKEIPSLNGLRGLAALMVLLLHVFLASRWLGWIPGDLAVVLFFELSGLLITWLLLTEKANRGAIDLKRFYSRRALRLLPAFYATWAAILFVRGVPDRWTSFFYVKDLKDIYYGLFHIWPAGPAVLAMSWSLGVEEKYYLIWPRLLQKFESRKIPMLLCVAAFADQLYHLMIFKLGYPVWAGYGFDARLDGVLLGSAVAVAAQNSWKPPRWLLHPASLAASVAAVMLIGHLPFPASVGWGVVAGSYPLLLILIYLVAKPPRILNNSIATFFGKISYSLYLSHLFVLYLLDFVHFGRTRWEVGAKVSLAILAATALYFLIERPFLRWKDRLHAKQNVPVPIPQNGVQWAPTDEEFSTLE
jgi:peptidoglycan/LPS O-acetylase OafA/YrhL